MNKFLTPAFFSVALFALPTIHLLAQDPPPRQASEVLEKATVALEDGHYDKAIEWLSKLAESDPKNVRCHLTLGDACFMAGRMEESVASYDRALKLRPELAPRCWQRGLALYYAGQFEAGQKQFEIHQTWNSSDVENAVWHMLCMAKNIGVEKARQQRIAISGDRRVPMAEIYDLFSGSGTPEAVLERAADATVSPARRKLQRYYANLYLGLYFEMIDQPGQSRQAMKRAASGNPIPRGQVMGAVADVHLRLRDPENRK